jgi:hypothetical protein
MPRACHCHRPEHEGGLENREKPTGPIFYLKSYKVKRPLANYSILQDQRLSAR